MPLDYSYVELSSGQPVTNCLYFFHRRICCGFIKVTLDDRCQQCELPIGSYGRAGDQYSINHNDLYDRENAVFGVLNLT